MNAPERFNTWRWEDEDDAKRVAYEPDTKLPNAGGLVYFKCNFELVFSFFV